MPIDRINWLAVVVGGVIYFLWGAVWFTVFSAQWLAAAGLSKSQMNVADPVPYIVFAAMALVLSFGVAVALSHDDNRTPAHGAQFGVFFGVFFLASILLSQNVAQGHPLSLWLLDAGYVVLGLVILGVLHGAWKKAPTKAAAPGS